MAYVRGLYPELAESNEANGSNGLSDELAEEVFAHFSGRRGAERLREEQRKAMDEASDYVEKAGVVAMFERLRDALKKFWNAARDLFAGKTRGIKSRSAEDFADMALADLLNGVKPDRVDRVDRNDREGDDDIQYEKVGGDENDNRAVTIIGAEKEHGFANFGEARKWAKKNIVGEYNNPEIGGVNISGTAIDKYLSEKAVSKSDNKDVHLSALKVMPSIIENSIVGEVHEDKKGDRHLKDVVRLYGAIDIDGQNYRVKTTVKRYNSENEKSKAYSYEVTEIELLEGTHGDDNNGELPRSGNNSISAAKLLKNIDKSYEKGKKLLDESSSTLEDSDVRFRGEEEPVFYSNAMRDVENIKQERATPEQWLKMIEKQGGMKAGNGYNENVLIHRVYGADSIDGNTYRVKVTLKEEGRNEDPTKAYSYEATKIELLDGQSGSPESLPRNSNNSISAAKLLKNIEKSYDKGKKLLYESSSELEDSDVRSGGASYEQQAIANAMLDRYYSCGYFKLTG